jgi:hypothetical protein
MLQLSPALLLMLYTGRFTRFHGRREVFGEEATKLPGGEFFSLLGFAICLVIVDVFLLQNNKRICPFRLSRFALENGCENEMLVCSFVSFIKQNDYSFV